MSAGTIIRVEKLHTLDQVAGAGAHNSRTNPPSHANSSVNIVILRGGETTAPELLIARLREAHIQIPLKKTGLMRKTKQPRRQRIIALNLLCGAGENLFRNVDANAWADRTLAFLDKTFGLRNVISAELHVDERVPHLHAIVVPITPEGRLSAARIFGQDQACQAEDLDGVRRGNCTVPFFRRLQREYHAMCRELDPSLTEPIPGGVLTHRMVAEWREWIAQAHQEIPTLPPATVEPPSLADRLNPSAYAQRQVDVYRTQVVAKISTLHAKAVLHDEQVASNQHMQRTLKKQDEELSRLKEQLVETQKRFHELQKLHEDVPLAELCAFLGLPVEMGGSVLLPNRTVLSVGAQTTPTGYNLPTWQAEPATCTLARALKITEDTLCAHLRGLIPKESFERLAIYRERHQFASMMGAVKGRQHWDEMRDFLHLQVGDFEGFSRVRELLDNNFGIVRPVLEMITDQRITLANTSDDDLAIKRFAYDRQDGGIMVAGSKMSADDRIFEQHMGSFRDEPLILAANNTAGTVIVSNAIEGLSMLSVELLTSKLQVIVSGEANLDRIARAALVRSHPVFLVEYSRGRRCSRHRKLRELINSCGGKTRPICPSDLRLGKAGFETIALEARRNPGMGIKLAQLFRLQATGGGCKPELRRQPVPDPPANNPLPSIEL